MQFELSHAIKNKGFMYGLRLHLRVIVALTSREMITAFGNRKLGYIWALLEPLAFTTLFILVHAYAKEHIPFGENAVLFMMSGILTFRVAISIAGKTLNAIDSNKTLLTFPHVKPLDTIFARIVIQSLTMLSVLVIFYSAVHWWQNIQVIVDPIKFSLGVMVTLFLASAVGMLNAVLVSILASWASIWSMMSLPLLIGSAVFYLPSVLPPLALKILLWNPLLHCVELVRSGSYLNYTTEATFIYPLCFGSICFVSSLIIERRFRTLILAKK